MATDLPGKPAVAWRWPIPVLAILVIAGSAGYWWAAFKTYHYREVVPGVLYRDGNQSLREFSTALQRSHAKTIACLIDDREMASPAKPQFRDEAEYAAAHAIRFIRIPIALGGWPTTDDVRKFLATVEDKNNQPVIVHCAQGVRRTGMMVAAYQLSVLGWDKAKTAAAIDAFGHSDRTTQDIRKFIEIYDPVTRTVTQTMQQSVE